MQHLVVLLMASSPSSSAYWRNLDAFDPVFGLADGSLESSVPCALLPFVFYLHSDRRCLRLQITDFHSNTWHTIQTPEQLDDLRDQVGIGGSWEDFLQYFRDSFASDNVKLILGGPASSIGGHGATSAKAVSQKSKGMPRISLSLESLSGTPAFDIMGLISVEMLKAFTCCRNTLETEKQNVLQLKESLTATKEELRLFKEEAGITIRRGKKRSRLGGSHPTLEMSDASYSQQEPTSASPDNSKTKVAAKVVPLGNKVHLAHAKRAKQRGSRLANMDDD